jgi:hypothetical protein
MRRFDFRCLTLLPVLASERLSGHGLLRANRANWWLSEDIIVGRMTKLVQALPTRPRPFSSVDRGLCSASCLPYLANSYKSVNVKLTPHGRCSAAIAITEPETSAVDWVNRKYRSYNLV